MIYAYAGISNSEHKIKSLDKELDTEKEKGHDLYKQVTALKSSYPDLNILLGVGGFEDQNNKEKYLELVSPIGAPYAATTTGGLAPPHSDGLFSNFGWVYQSRYLLLIVSE